MQLQSLIVRILLTAVVASQLLLDGQVLVDAGGCVVKNAQCFVDDQSRILGGVNSNWADGLSNEWCAQLCADQNKAYAGSEDGT